MELRVLKHADLESIREIASYSFDKLWSEKDFSYFIEHPQGIKLGLFSGSKLNAYVLALNVQGDLDVISIAVHRDYRRQGLAERLMHALFEKAQAARVFLEVESTNLSALSLYQKLGLSIYGVRKKYYAGVKDAVLMKAEPLPVLS